MAGSVNERAALESEWLRRAVEQAVESPHAAQMRIGDNLRISAVTKYDRERDCEQARVEITFDVR